MAADRSRRYCFTINNYTDEDIDKLLDGYYKYIVFGFETGEKNTPHIQGYVYYHEAKSMKAVSKDLPRAHLTIAKGTPQQNYDYCSKDGNYYEFGEIPQQGRAMWDKIEYAMANPKDYPLIYNQYRKMYKEVIGNETKDHKRELVAIQTNVKYELADYLGTTHKVFMDDDIDTYEGEDVIFINQYSPFKVEQWYKGYPQRIRRGYEIVKCDPNMVIMVCDDHEEYENIKLKYSYIELVKNDWRNSVSQKEITAKKAAIK